METRIKYKTTNGQGHKLLSFGRYGMATWSLKFVSGKTMRQIQKIVDSHLDEMKSDPSSPWRESLSELYEVAHHEVITGLYNQGSIIDGADIEHMHTYFPVWNFKEGETVAEMDYDEQQTNLILSWYWGDNVKLESNKGWGDLDWEEIDNA